MDVMKTLNSIYCEISEYNNHWNKFSGLLFLVFIQLICTLVYQVIYHHHEMNPIFIFIYTAVSMINFSVLCFHITSAAFIEKETKITYKLINSLFVHIGRIAVSRRLKVYFKSQQKYEDVF